MKQLTAVLFICLLATPIFAQKTIRRSVYFESNQAQLSAESRTFLKAFADTLKRYATYTVALKGHTDADGSDNTNKLLSEKRVKNVQILLENNGILPKNITISVLGEAAPITENTTVEGKQRNRRVEIITTIYPPNTAAPNTAKSYQNVTDLYRDLSQPPQYFKVNTGQETTIRGAKGTVFVIPKDAFQGVPANAVVDFKLKEAYSFSDIIAENLSTHSGDKLLQTGGMFYAEAVYNGQSVNLKKALNVSFASKESKLEGMQLFTGTRDPQRNGRMDWQPIKEDPSVSAAFEDDTLEIYTRPTGLIDPYLISDKNGYIKFKDLLDTSNLAYSQLLVPVKDEKGKSNLLPRRGITKVGAAIAFYLLDHRVYLKKTFLETHKATFSEVYDFYKINTFADLEKQNSGSWDSLMQIRAKVLQFAMTEEQFKQREDSIKKVNDRQQEAWRLAQEQRKTLNDVFTLPRLGWINCDKYYSYPFRDVADITANNCTLNGFSNLILILKKNKEAVNAYSVDKNAAFPRILANQNAVIIGMKIENGQPYLALKPITTANMSVDLDFKAVSAEDIKEQLKTLDN